MNTTLTIKPSGIMDRTNAIVQQNIVNNTLWSDTAATWSDSTVMWSSTPIVLGNNAVPPNGIIENIKGKLGVQTIKP